MAIAVMLLKLAEYVYFKREYNGEWRSQEQVATQSMLLFQERLPEKLQQIGYTDNKQYDYLQSSVCDPERINAQ